MHEASYARVPRGVKSGKGLNALVEMDEAQLTPILKLHQKSWSHYWGLALSIIANTYMKEQDIVYFDNENESHSLENFLGSRIGKTRKVRVSLGASLPMSLQARKEFILSLQIVIDKHCFYCQKLFVLV